MSSSVLEGHSQMEGEGARHTFSNGRTRESLVLQDSAVLALVVESLSASILVEGEHHIHRRRPNHLLHNQLPLPLSISSSSGDLRSSDRRCWTQIEGTCQAVSKALEWSNRGS